MLDSREFRELLIADIALVRDVAKARDVAAALQRFWEQRESSDISLADELARIAQIQRDALRPIEEEVDRLLEYMNWACTEEGIVFSNFGVEGITYNYVNGVPVFTDLIKTLDNPDGKHVIMWGFASIYFIVRHPEAIRTQQGQVFLDVGKAVGKQDYIKSIAWELTEAQDKELINLETVLNDVRDEYITKFMIVLGFYNSWNKNNSCAICLSAVINYTRNLPMVFRICFCLNTIKA